jgi:hypothetical protein
MTDLEKAKEAVAKLPEFATYKTALEALANTPEHIAYKKALETEQK